MNSPRGAGSAALLLTALCAAGSISACADAGAPYVAESVALPAATIEGSFPYLAADDSGGIVLSWSGRDADSTPFVRFALRDAAGTWSQVHTLARDPLILVNFADFASVIPMRDGRLVGQWLRRVPPPSRGYELWLAQSVDRGSTWSAPVVPHPRGGIEYGFAAVAPLGDGAAAVHFLDGRDGGGSAGAMQLAEARFDASGRAGASQILDTRVCDCCQTDVAQTPHGRVLVYRDRDANERRDIALLRERDGAWLPPVLVYDDNWIINACPVNGPGVATDGERLAVVWYTGAGDTARVRVTQSFDGGAVFSTPTELSSGAVTLGRVDVAYVAPATPIVTWMDRTADNRAEVRAAVLDSAGTIVWSTTLGVTDSRRTSGFPRIVRGADGVYVAWTEVAPGGPMLRLARVRAR